MGASDAYILACECPDTVVGVEGALIQWLTDNHCHAVPYVDEPVAYLYVSEDCRYTRRMGFEFTCESTAAQLRTAFITVADRYRMTRWTIETPGGRQRLTELLEPAASDRRRRGQRSVRGSVARLAG